MGSNQTIRGISRNVVGVARPLLISMKKDWRDWTLGELENEINNLNRGGYAGRSFHPNALYVKALHHLNGLKSLWRLGRG